MLISPTVDLLIVLLFSLIFGSFINALIYRIPKDIPIFSKSRSHCPKCHYEIRWYENIPIVSYIFLKGKCSNCKKRISFTYPLVEILSALIIGYFFYKFNFSALFFLYAFLALNLILLSFIDLKYKAVPDYLLISALILGILIGRFEMALLFMGGAFLLELFVTFYIQRFKSKITNNASLHNQRAMGEGDIPIFGIIGAILGIELGLSAIFCGAIFAIIPAVVSMITKKDIETAFIPYLSMGLLFVLVSKFNLLLLFV